MCLSGMEVFTAKGAGRAKGRRVEDREQDKRWKIERDWRFIFANFAFVAV